MEKLLKQSFDLGDEGGDLFHNFHNERITPTYENELFMESDMPGTIALEAYGLAANDEVEKFKKTGYFSDEKYRKVLKQNYNYISVPLLSYLYDELKKYYEVEPFVQIKGQLKTTAAFLYLKEERVAIITEECNPEDVLNLMSVKGLKLYICRALYNETEFRYVAIEVLRSEQFYERLESDLRRRQERVKKAKKWIKVIKPKLPQGQYLSLEDEEGCLEFYNSLSEEKRRVFTRFFMDVKGDNVVKNVSGHFDTILEWVDKIEVMDLFVQSISLLYKYQEANKARIEEDKKRYRHDKDWMSALKYKVLFSEYKVLLKEVGKRYRDAKKWAEALNEIVKQNEVIVVKKPNKDTIYWQAVMEAKEALMKLWFVSEAHIYGSVARGEEKYQSDIDIMFRIGIDVSKLTPSRREMLFKIVKSKIDQVEEKYEKLIDGFPKPLKHGLFKEEGLFQLLAWDLQKKNVLTALDKSGAFENTFELFKREGIYYNFGDKKEYIAYGDMEYMIVPTLLDGWYIYILKELCEMDGSVEFQYLKWYFLQKEAVTFEDSFGVVTIEKDRFMPRVQLARFATYAELEEFLSLGNSEREVKLSLIGIGTDYGYYDDKDVKELYAEACDGGIRSLK